MTRCTQSGGRIRSPQVKDRDVIVVLKNKMRIMPLGLLFEYIQKKKKENKDISAESSEK